MFPLLTKNTFEGQHEDEQVLLLLRRHWFVPTLMILGFFVVTAIPYITILVFVKFLESLGILSLVWFGMLLWLAIAWQGLFYGLMNYILDVWLVTNQRIIDSQQLRFFSRRVIETRVDRVQDVTTSVSSLIPNILDFGDIAIQTAGAVEKIFFRQVPKPNEVKNFILKIGLVFPAKQP